MIPLMSDNLLFNVPVGNMILELGVVQATALQSQACTAGADADPDAAAVGSDPGASPVPPPADAPTAEGAQVALSLDASPPLSRPDESPPVPRSAGPADAPTASVGATDGGHEQIGTGDQAITQLQSALRELWQEISTHTHVEGHGSKGIPVTRGGDDFFTAMARVLGDTAQREGNELQRLSEILSADVRKAMQAAAGSVGQRNFAIDRALFDQTRLLDASERMCTLLQAINMGVNAAGDALKVDAHLGGGQPAGSRGAESQQTPVCESASHAKEPSGPAETDRLAGT